MKFICIEYVRFSPGEQSKCKADTTMYTFINAVLYSAEKWLEKPCRLKRVISCIKNLQIPIRCIWAELI